MEGLTPAGGRDWAWLRPWLRACEPEAQGVGWVQPGGRLGSPAASAARGRECQPWGEQV